MYMDRQNHLGGRPATLRRVCLGEVVAVLVVDGSVDGLLKDGLGLVDLELGLEVGEVVREGAAVGATTGVGEGEALVLDFLAEAAPDFTVLAGL